MGSVQRLASSLTPAGESATASRGRQRSARGREITAMTTLTRTRYGDSTSHHAIAASPEYKELVRGRNRLAWTLSIAVLAIYLGFIFLVAFDKPLLARKVAGTTS